MIGNPPTGTLSTISTASYLSFSACPCSCLVQPDTDASLPTSFLPLPLFPLVCHTSHTIRCIHTPFHLLLLSSCCFSHSSSRLAGEGSILIISMQAPARTLPNPRGFSFHALNRPVHHYIPHYCNSVEFPLPELRRCRPLLPFGFPSRTNSPALVSATQPPDTSQSLHPLLLVSGPWLVQNCLFQGNLA